MPQQWTYQSDRTFCEVIAKVIDEEGGYSNNPNDRGGPTKYGVAWNYCHDYLHNHYGFVKPVDVAGLTLDQAKQLYYDLYWVPSGAEGITDEALAYEHLDAAINCGTGQAAKFLARLSRNPANYDGTGGKNRSIFLRLLLEYTALRIGFYTHCKDRDHFLGGWMNRLVLVLNNSLNMD